MTVSYFFKKYLFLYFYRWSTVSASAQLFGDDQEDKQKSIITRTEPVKKCQRVLKFFNNSESATPKNLFNTKPNQKELSKLHKQVFIIFFFYLIVISKFVLVLLAAYSHLLHHMYYLCNIPISISF